MRFCKFGFRFAYPVNIREKVHGDVIFIDLYIIYYTANIGFVKSFLFKYLIKNSNGSSGGFVGICHCFVTFGKQFKLSIQPLNFLRVRGNDDVVSLVDELFLCGICHDISYALSGHSCKLSLKL